LESNFDYFNLVRIEVPKNCFTIVEDPAPACFSNFFFGGLL